MIKSFADQTTRDIFEGADTKSARKIPKNIWSVARRKLEHVNHAGDLDDLRTPPGNQLKSLKGDLKGLYSIRINDQFRVVFAFADGNATEVIVTDYH